MLRKGVILPYSIVTLHQGHATLAVSNTTDHPVVLPKGFCLALIQPLQGAHIAAVVEDHLPMSPPSATTGSSAHDVWDTIDDSLPAPEKQQLFDLLNKFRSTFDSSSSSLGKANLVEHRIHTEASEIVRHRPYRVSLSERKVI